MTRSSATLLVAALLLLLAGFTTMAQQRQVQYEYAVIFQVVLETGSGGITYTESFNLDCEVENVLIRVLDCHGREGWELVSATLSDATGGRAFYLKRLRE